MFTHTVELDPAALEASLALLPARSGVFAIHFRDVAAQPYVTQAADIRRRARRLLESPTASSKRLSLRAHASRVSYACTGSQLATLLLLYRALPDARQRLKLRPPPLVRFAAENRYPRCYISNRLGLRNAQLYFGPFASRLQAETYLDAVLDLFLLRRCQPDLVPDPAFPGCIYSEMHKCLAPCFAGCTDERYTGEAAAVLAFLQTRGASLLEETARERDSASERLDFEAASLLHARHEKVKAVAALAPELARPVPALRGIILEPSAEPDCVQLFLFMGMRFFGPVNFSTLGIRHGNEQSKSSSLFVQPLQLMPVALRESDAPSESETAEPQATPEQRLTAAIAELETLAASAARLNSSATACDHLALLRRWFYRPDTKRTGELFLLQPGEPWPTRRLLRGVSRVFLGRTGVAAAPQHALPS